MMTNVLEPTTRRLMPIRESNVGEQGGFRVDRGNIDQIFILRRLLEMCRTHCRPTVVNFL